MPPKSGKKKTKAEKDKKKKEEAERKAQEEEEARIAAEKEEEARKLREAQEEEENRRLEIEERVRRKWQLQELDQLWTLHTLRLATEAAERRERQKWARYMQCDGSPDPAIAGEINTYMNLWSEERDNNDIHSVLFASDLTLGLLAELEFLLEDTPAEELTESQVTQYKNTILELQLLLQKKFDLATHDVLLQATRLADSETLNLQQVIGSGDIILCVWGNLSKNPRIKSFEFPETEFQFEIPRLLTLSDCGVRVLWTKYDHYSSYCKTFLPRLKQKQEEEVPEPEPEEQGEVKEGEGQAEGQQEGEEGEGVSREETQDVMSALRDLDKDDEEGETGGEGEKQEEQPPAEEEPMEEEFEIVTPVPEEWEEFDDDEDVLDLRAYHVLGGAMHFSLLHLPPQPKTANEWTITQLVDPPGLLYMDYVADSETNSGNQSASQSAKAGETGSQKGTEGEIKREEKPPIGVTLTLPKEVYFCEEPQVVRWDNEQKQWRLDGFSDFNFSEETRKFSFKTTTFGTIALVQDAHINMPFQSWEVRPRGQDTAQLTIIAAIVEAEIQIKGEVCCLSMPEDREEVNRPELMHLKDKWMSAPDLIKKMRGAGVNIFPAEDSHKYVNVLEKNGATEQRLYQQMALSASTMAFSWSKWNSEVQDKERIVVQASEHLKDEALLEEDWSLYSVTKKRTTKLKMTEFDEAFSDEHADGTEFHADMYHISLELASAEGKERILNTDYKFVNTVYQLLQATKLLTYS